MKTITQNELDQMFESFQKNPKTQFNLRESDMRGLVCKDRSLTKIIQSANANRSHWQEIDLSGSNLTFISLSKSCLTSADFSRAILRGAELIRVDAEKAVFIDANLTGTHLCLANLKGSRFLGATLTGTDFREADLTAADFSHTNLSNTFLEKSILDGADLSFCKFGKVSLDGVSLQGAHLLGSDLSETHLERSINWWRADSLTDCTLPPLLEPFQNMNPLLIEQVMKCSIEFDYVDTIQNHLITWTDTFLPLLNEILTKLIPKVIRK